MVHDVRRGLPPNDSQAPGLPFANQSGRIAAEEDRLGCGDPFALAGDRVAGVVDDGDG